MADVYGESVGQGLADTTWLADAGHNGWVVLMKDDKIRFRPAELEALTLAGVRAFCLTNANLRGQEMARRFVTQLETINRIAAEQRDPTSSAYMPTASALFGRKWPRSQRCVA